MDNFNYFNVPSHLNYIEISNILGLPSILDDVSMLKSLRDLFAKDKMKFEISVSKLRLIGVVFTERLGEKHFKNSNIKHKHYVKYVGDEEAYFELDTDSKLEYFCYRYNIRKFSSFNYMSIEELGYLLKLNEDYIIQYFNNHEFMILSFDEIPNDIDSIGLVEDEYDNEEEYDIEDVSEIIEGVVDELSTSIIDSCEPRQVISMSSISEKTTETSDWNSVKDIFESGYKYLRPFNIVFDNQKKTYQDEFLTALIRTVQSKALKRVSSHNKNVVERFLEIPPNDSESFRRNTDLRVDLYYLNGVALSKFRNDDIIQKDLTQTMGFFINGLSNNFIKWACERNGINYLDVLEKLLNIEASNDDVSYVRSIIQPLFLGYDTYLIELKVRAKFREISKHDIFRDLYDKPFVENTLYKLKLKLQNFDINEITYSLLFENLKIFNHDELHLLYGNIVALLKKIKSYEFSIPTLPQRNLEVLQLRSKGKTLEEIGSKVGVSRERIRQIESKTKAKLVKSASYLYTILKPFFNADLGLTIEDLVSKGFVNGDYEFLVIKSFVLDNKYFQNIKTESSMITVNSSLINLVDGYIFEHGSIINKKLLRDFVIRGSNELVNFATLNTILDKYFSTLGYLITDDFYSKGGRVIDKIIYLLENETSLNRVINLDKEGFYEINDLFTRYFDDQSYSDYEANYRALFARVDDALDESVIRVSKSEFTLTRYLRFNLDDLDILREILSNAFISTIGLTVLELYENNQEKLTSISIDNHYLLYSLIKLYFTDEYETGHHNTMLVSRVGVPKKNTKKEVLRKYLKKKNRPVSKEEIRNDLRYKEVDFQNIVSNNNEVISYLDENNKVLVRLASSVKLSKDTRNSLLRISNGYLDKYGCIPVNVMFDELLYSEHFDELMDNGLSDKSSLSGYLKVLNINLRGTAQLLYLKEKRMNLNDIITAKYPDSITYEELSNICNDMGYSEQTLRDTYNIMPSLGYLPLGNRGFIHEKELMLDDKRDEIIRIADEVILNVDFLNLDTITVEDFKYLFTNIDISPILLFSILQRLGLPVFETNPDYRFPKIVLLNRNEGLNNLVDLVDKLLARYFDRKATYSDSISFNEVSNQINDLNIMSINVFKNELIKSKKFYLDKFGWIRKF